MFRIKRSAQLKKLMIAYCDKKSAELDNMRFVHNGRLVRPNLTPDEVPSLSISIFINLYTRVCACLSICVMQFSLLAVRVYRI